MTEITARRAGSIVRGWLKSWGIEGVSVTAETISFSDLARCSKVFVAVHGGTFTPEQWSKIIGMARVNGFFIHQEGGIS